MVEKIPDLEYTFTNVERNVTQVRLPYCGRNQRVDDIAYQGSHDSRERRADDHRDGQVHYIAAQYKVAKTFEHRCLLALCMTAYQPGIAMTKNLYRMTSGVKKQEHRHRQDHQVRAKQQKNARIIKCPAPAQAAGRFHHAPER